MRLNMFNNSFLKDIRLGTVVVSSGNLFQGVRACGIKVFWYNEVLAQGIVRTELTLVDLL